MLPSQAVGEVKAVAAAAVGTMAKARRGEGVKDSIPYPAIMAKYELERHSQNFSLCYP